MTQPDSTTNTGAVEALADTALAFAEYLRRVPIDPDIAGTIGAAQVLEKCAAALRVTPTSGSEAEVIERCAKVADDAYDKFLATYEVEYNRKRYDVPSMDRARKKAAGIISEDIAADIRALSPAKEPRDD